MKKIFKLVNGINSMCDIEIIVFVCVVWFVFIIFVLWLEEIGCIYFFFILLMLFNLVKVK